jgi:DNA processing protein
MKDPDEVFYSIALTQVPQIGSVHSKTLLEHFNAAKTIFHARPSALEKIPGIGIIRARNICNFRDFKKAEKEMVFIEKFKIAPLLFHGERYPQRLKHCEDPPPILFFKGEADLNVQKVLSVVGTRKQTEYGRGLVEEYLEALSCHDVLVVSGLAYGIDQIAHKAALNNRLKTIGVLASGLDIIYPSSHSALARDMTRQGGLLTEFLSGTKPDKQNFPRRNRIVAGLCDALLVAETDVKGGSMITADIASGYNREIFAIPGRIHDRKSAGCNILIRDNKARLTMHPADMAAFMNWEAAHVTIKQQKIFPELGEDEARIMNIVRDTDTIQLEQLIQLSGINRSHMHAALLNLELAGLLIHQPGGRWAMGST